MRRYADVLVVVMGVLFLDPCQKSKTTVNAIFKAICLGSCYLIVITVVTLVSCLRPIRT